MKIAIIWALVLSAIAMMIVPHSFIQAATDPNVVAKTKITAAIDQAVNGQWKGICTNALTTGFNQTLRLVYDKDVNRCHGIIVPPPPPVCQPGTHLENGVCVPDVIPPPPLPTANVSKVCLVGDLSGSTVPNLMKGCDYKIGLGDLGYKSDLSWFKSLNFNKCVIGNHDATEDGSSSIYKEALSYCGDHWSFKPTANVLILGFNTNGDTASQVGAAKNVLGNPNTMANVKTVIAVSHKGGHVPPNSHHPAEAASLYSQLEKLIPSGVKLIEIYGHNHVMSSAPSMNWYQSGGGGKSHYSCGTDSTWTFCDNSNWGYLELTVDNQNGNTAAKFVK